MGFLDQIQAWAKWTPQIPPQPHENEIVITDDMKVAEKGRRFDGDSSSWSDYILPTIALAVVGGTAAALKIRAKKFERTWDAITRGDFSNLPDDPRINRSLSHNYPISLANIILYRIHLAEPGQSGLLSLSQRLFQNADNLIPPASTSTTDDIPPSGILENTVNYLDDIEQKRLSRREIRSVLNTSDIDPTELETLMNLCSDMDQFIRDGDIENLELALATLTRQELRAVTFHLQVLSTHVIHAWMADLKKLGDGPELMRRIHANEEDFDQLDVYQQLRVILDEMRPDINRLRTSEDPDDLARVRAFDETSRIIPLRRALVDQDKAVQNPTP